MPRFQENVDFLQLAAVAFQESGVAKVGPAPTFRSCRGFFLESFPHIVIDLDGRQAFWAISAAQDDGLFELVDEIC